MAGKGSTAEQQQTEQEPHSQQEQEAEPMRENPRMGFVESLITHPLRHLLSPGFGNKTEAVFSVGGRVAAGYLIYKGVRWGITKIWG